MNLDVLVKFLRNATFGEISLRMTSAQVRDILGKPHDTSFRNPPIWKYGDLEIAFREDKVWLISLLLDGRDPISPNSILANCRSVEAMKTILNDRSISYEIYPRLTFDSQIAWRVIESNVVILFSENRLYSISVMMES